MKYLPQKDIETIVNGAINFSTRELHIIGSCDVYTTKNAGDDKKLYKYIEDTLETRYEALVRLSASLSPPAAEFVRRGSASKDDGDHRRKSRTASTPQIDLSRDSPFGSLSKMGARRTFAYLIATLNATHPDYDFSHVLKPKDFKRERSLKTLMNTFNDNLGSCRARGLAPQYLSVPNSHSSLVAASNDIWSTRHWEIIDKVMDLKNCERYSYAYANDLLDGEETAIWSMHYFFFNKELKRVCYLYVRALSVLSHSPVMSHIKQKSSPLSRNESASKRATYWLGEKGSDIETEDDRPEDESMDWYPESSDDDDLDRPRTSDLDEVRYNLSEPAYGDSTFGDEIGATMEL